MIVIEAPQPIEAQDYTIFLAGSIEMGTAEEWQSKVIRGLEDRDCTILNPRRKDWDSTWVQSIDNPQFREQVTWELDGLEAANVIVFYFDPNTKSPITLMELGMQCDADKRIIVCCPEGFWRKGNVDVVCERYAFTQVSSLKELIAELRCCII